MYCLLKDGYPAGDEVILTYETTGRVVPQGGIPLNVGIMVMNVETAFNVYNAVRKNNPVTHKYLTVSGAVNTPKTLYVPIGIKFKELIPEVNGINIEEYKLLVGGPMTGRIGNLNETVTKTTKGIFILPKDNPIIELKEYNLNSLVKRSMGTCSQCRMCTDLCPRNLVGHSIEPHKIMNSLIFGLDFNSEVFINALACCECNLCSAYACHQSLNPKAIISELKTKLREQGIKPRFNNEAIVKEEREYRRVPVKRVISRLKLSEFDKDAPIADIKDKPSILKINKKQSIGILVNTVVKIGDRVKKKDVIGVIDEKDLGVYLHSPIDGIIIDIDKDSISIRKEE
ncbi:4Fe-4S dicluster domain-containing protein [Clostridium chauvoei]|uniref:4Fe-4S dicluster domain-containing protein n=1 Tax=Clostridium chauvoei TaxID=46867 RepID=UPI002889E90D|nr:4Fe-4S dicluster domain-containing protein [Clostridium chauvoei]